MSKLYKLKEWLTVSDAAKYLSHSLEEDVTEADILRLGLDGHIKLSVYLPNGAQVKRGKIVTHSIDELVAAIARDEVPDNLTSIPVPRSFAQKGLAAIHDKSEGSVPFITSLRLSDTQWATLNHEEVTSVWGLWDLPMIGGERLDIEHQYLALTGGPSITAETLDGAFLVRGPDDICQVQADFDDNEYQQGSKAQGLELERYITERNIESAEAERLRETFNAKREKYKEARRIKKYHENFYPSGGLPDDSVLVVRTQVLDEFKQTLVEPETKEIGTRERDTLYKIIIGMAIRGYGHDASAQRSSAIADIARDLEEVGLPVSDDTIRKYMKEAAALLDSKSA
ncbi:Uncharacterised protein [Bordetella hinzii]|uniref:hypothetical protein n=1 Tax=Bordetella hinzii TaxID=103855 RepID=UPI0004973EFC|nr:hypothetical protein [Bordetella hinzii]AKQ56398.1 hypothetical protein ACR54_03096 [Bordetella hinzii]SNV74856.1 Uncharacterised protein [Bordetella hinzii]